MMKDRACAPFVKVSSALVVTSNNILAILEEAPEHSLGGFAARHADRAKS